jgi:hypothetical protein
MGNELVRNGSVIRDSQNAENQKVIARSPLWRALLGVANV